MKTWIILSLIAFTSVSYAQKKTVYSTNAGAASGYDIVAYFKIKTPTKGSEKYSIVWKGAKWLFSTEENMNDFKKTPGLYIPQYGGYCAYAVSKGYTAKSDPTAWKIVNGKLYLNYNQIVKVKWEKNQAERIKSANANWPQVLDN